MNTNDWLTIYQWCWLMNCKTPIHIKCCTSVFHTMDACLQHAPRMDTFWWDEIIHHECNWLIDWWNFVLHLQIWNSSYPATVKYSHDMKKFSWKYTQFSQFNQSDTLLLVSGVHFGSPHSTSGEIAVFSVTGAWTAIFLSHPIHWTLFSSSQAIHIYDVAWLIDRTTYLALGSVISI